MVSHRASVVAISAVKVSTAATSIAFTRREGGPTAATTTAAAVFVLGLGFLNVDASTIDLSHRVVLDQILSDTLVCEGDEAETARRARVDIFEDNGVVDLAKLHEMLLELLAGQFEIKAADEDLALRVGELDAVFFFATDTHAVLLHDLHVGVWFLDLLSIVVYHKLVVVVSTVMMPATITMAHIATTFSFALMVIR